METRTQKTFTTVPGEKMEDGTIYAGISPDTHRPMYATPEDAPGVYQFYKATQHAESLDAHGHRDWRVPTKGELDVLFRFRAAIGGFNISGSSPAGWYWSSSDYNHGTAWDRRFSDGLHNNSLKVSVSSLRCVRMNH